MTIRRPHPARLLPAILPAIAATALALTSVPATAQSVEVETTLESAIRLALQSHRPLEAVRAEAEAAALGAGAANAERWPELALSAGGTWSDDPVAVFGTRLRQQRFTQADFDVRVLNDPGGIGDWNAGLQARWSPFDFARDAGIERARILARAAEAGAERQAEVVVYRTRALYAAAIVAEARLSTVASALAAARATRDIVARRVDQGFLMERDLLRTEAALAGALADSVRARAALDDTRGRLGLHLALGPDTVPVPVVAADPAGAPGGAAGEAPGGARSAGTPLDATPSGVRSDLEAERLAAEAARIEADAARGTRLPSVELTGAVTGHAASDFDASGLFGTIGLAVRVPLFTSGRIGHAVDRADALARAADLRNREAIAAAEVELREARRAVDAAQAALEAATRGAEAAAEARRLTRLRLDQGLATPDEALQADADAVHTDAMRIDALMNLELSRAALDLARGGLPDDGDSR